MTEIEIMQMKRENKKLRQNLQKLSDRVLICIYWLEKVMVGPSTPDRGRKIARMCNFLEGTNDVIRYTSLKVNFRTDDKKKVAERLIKKVKQQNLNGTL